MSAVLVNKMINVVEGKRRTGMLQSFVMKNAVTVLGRARLRSVSRRSVRHGTLAPI